MSEGGPSFDELGVSGKPVLPHEEQRIATSQKLLGKVKTFLARGFPTHNRIPSRTTPDQLDTETILVEKEHEVGVPHIAIVAHNADTLVLVEKANADNTTEIEINVNSSREPFFIRGRHTAVVRHGIAVPFREYPTVESLINHIDPDKTLVMDLKMLPHHPFERRKARRLLEHMQYLLPILREQGREDIAITGGTAELMDSLSEHFPDVELRYTIWSRRGFYNVMRRGEKVKAVSVKADVVKKLGIEVFKGKEVYVFGVDPQEEEEFREMGVSGIISDKYRDFKVKRV